MFTFLAKRLGIDSEKEGQYELVIWLVILLTVLIVWWGSQMDQEGRLTIIGWLLVACGVLIPFALGMRELQRFVVTKLGNHLPSATTHTEPANPPVKPEAPYDPDAYVSDQTPPEYNPGGNEHARFQKMD